VELWGAGDGLGEEEAASAIEAAQRALLPGTGDAHAPEPPPSLSVARRIADRLGHRIEVAARPGRGVVFSVDLPLVDAVAVRSAPRADLAARALPRPVMPSRGTVFVIDDDPFVRDTLRDVLEATGWTSETFASAEAFLAADRPDRSGCVVVDAMLPGISGLALLRTLRDQRQRLLPIMLTGAGDIRMAVEAMAAGALNFIEKPVRYEELLPIIERAFDTLADAGKAAVWREQARRRAASLTTRQRQILNLVLAGEPSRKIAAGLGVSRRTVENHRAIIMRKMGAESMPQLIRAGMAET
jgi:two-component system CheB/CheR fusion protein